ncbi:MAG: elongation factor G, partial [Bacteroidales bacterium]|nr:elongation factor G [Bacteroidales bacterium]
MKTYETQNIRNVVLLGSTRSGKTTLAEAMLFEGKVIDRKGSVEAKTTVSDNTEFEQVNQKSVFATPLYTEFMNHKFNFVDAPGSDDFSGGAVSAFKVCESAVLLVNAQQGVEVGTEIYGRYAEEYKVPVIIGVNQLDGEKANWDSTVAAIKESFGARAVVIQFPVNAGVEFNAFIDVLTMKMYRFKDDNGTREELDIPAEYADQAEELHMALTEKAAEYDEALMEKFFDEMTLSTDEIRKGIGMGIRSGEAYPILCLSGKKSIGVKRLMEFVINNCPAPSERPAHLKDGGELACDPAGKTAIFVYKTALEQHLGEVSYFKVMSGSLTPCDLENAATGDKERLTAIYAVAGKNKTQVDRLNAGDLGCTVKLKAAKTNVTLCQIGSDIACEGIKFPAPKYRCAIKAVDQKEEEKLGEALNKITSEDPTLIVQYAKELKQTILQGNGEQQINFVKWRLKNEFKIEVEFSAPRISYRETITKVATAQYRHKKQSGGAGQFGEVHLLVEPIVEGVETTAKFKIDGKDTVLNIKGKEEETLSWGGKLEFYNCVVGGAIDASFMPAIKKGIMQKMEEGPLTGSYARDIRVFVYDGKMHPVDSKEIAFILAARNAFKEAFRNAGPKIMEPIYNVQVMTPADYMGACMSDLQNRRALIEGMGTDRGFSVLKARVPLAELYKYSTTLSSITSGSATFTMEFAEYQTVPADVQQKLIQAYMEEETEE